MVSRGMNASGVLPHDFQLTYHLQVEDTEPLVMTSNLQWKVRVLS
ncbi:hypothetical protein [Sulfuracidifex tepidarius]|uniref:Uncharacterized protein n=1 Tax=Sulfuracidifex tepidarius TaxID=1294262 RepID=A0A510DZK0_9CREN|nr:hypothetical protein [Sulfuracidifex tepidarius]BBG22812.1 hypothetical protein IC006_0096 [Sulfuracidifex tepidarius]BBG25589.1 hypothetical protein IC007_0094 [Sulfuracidifex tepidarius]